MYEYTPQETENAVALFRARRAEADRRSDWFLTNVLWTESNDVVDGEHHELN